MRLIAELRPARPYQHEAADGPSVQQQLTGELRSDAEEKQTVRTQLPPLEDRKACDPPPTWPGLTESLKNLYDLPQIPGHPGIPVKPCSPAFRTRFVNQIGYVVSKGATIG